MVKTLRPVEEYDGRDGYAPTFLGATARVPLPKLSDAQRDDAAAVNGGGVELRYHHFSVVQSKKRRMCFFSACNIDGAKSRTGSKRSNVWRYDPRIATKYQLIDECYGNEDEGLFSRGHMTRREDPVWGADKKEAEEDTFHATNQVPQMQSHNSPVWLALEDHVLRNADKDNQKVTVITGPVLSRQDPVLYDVKVPVRLWKIVAFLRPNSKALASVAYLDSQATFLPDPGGPAFVWGQFKGMQVPVTRLEQLTRLDFGPLTRADVLNGVDPSFSFDVRKVQDILLA
ncbi:MAG: DNA/RNA non-specific endonuclease [Vicinamibacterales bacterium]